MFSAVFIINLKNWQKKKTVFLLREEEAKEEEVVVVMGTLNMLNSASGLEWSSADLEGVILIDQQ